MSQDAPKSSTLGYPRIGENREMKRSLESYWAGVISEGALLGVSEAIEASCVADQAAAGIDLIGVGDHTLYDHVLDWTHRLGTAPERFHNVSSDLKSLDTYFAMARGHESASALDMSKFFGTNYHYLVPELSDKTTPKPSFDKFLAHIRSAQNGVGEGLVAPIILGPITYVKLAKLTNIGLEEMVRKILPAYVQLLERVKALKVVEVQIHEPALVLEDAATLKSAFKEAFGVLAAVGVPIHLVTYFDGIAEEVYPWLTSLPGLAAISLDFTRGNNLDVIKKCGGFPESLRLGAGVIDARSVWSDAESAPKLLADIRAVVGPNVAVCVQPSASLQFLPLDLRAESELPDALKCRLAFARQKLDLVAGLANGKDISSGLANKGVASGDDKKQASATLSEDMFERKPAFDARRSQQFTVPGGYATTTIGSFPQTPQIRKFRLQRKKGIITEEQYNYEVDKQISFAIGVQEALGLDVLVHGEPERTDMVRAIIFLVLHC